MAIPKTNISSGQVLQNSYDETNQALRTTATAVISGTLEVEVNAADGDNVAISDGTDTMAVNADGSINANITNAEIAIELNAADGDNVAISDGTNTLDVNPDGSINVNVLTSDIDVSLNSVEDNVTIGDASGNLVTTTLVAAKRSLDVNVAATTSDAILTNIETAINALPTDNNGIQIGTEDGTLLGTQRVFVNNVKQQILATQDRAAAFTYADFGTKNQRVTRIDYVSSLFPSTTVRRDFTYSLVGTRYRRDNENWSIV